MASSSSAPPPHSDSLDSVDFIHQILHNRLDDALAKASAGHLHPRPISVASIPVPASPLAVAADKLAQASVHPSILAHCKRTYLFGAAMAREVFPDLEWNLETFYLTAILHDVKCSAEAFRQSGLSFEFHGGMTARTFLSEVAGASAEVADTVMEAICRHKEIGDPAFGFSPEGMLLRIGAQVDVFGSYSQFLHPDTIANIVRAFPRAGFNNVFADTLVEEVRTKRFCTTAVILANDRAVENLIRNNPVMHAYDH